MKESDKQASPPRESRTLSRVALGALCLLVLVYFGLQLRDYLVDPFSTAAAAYTKVEETVSANGWLIRAEQVLPGEGSGLLRLTRQEGERVSQGGTVAKVYADQASLDRQTELDRLDERIEQLRYAAEESLSGVASLRLDSQIQDSLLSLRRAVEGGALAQAESEISQLRSLVLKRDYSRGDGTDAAAELAELQAQRKTLAAQGANSVRTLTAPKSGIYSAVVDGYETVLTPESLDTLTPSALSALTADSAVSSNVGKLITSDRWYYAAALPDDDAADLTEGQSVTLRFSKGAADDLPAEVWRVGESENGRTLVILSGREYLSELTLLRHQSASIILKTTEGLAKLFMSEIKAIFMKSLPNKLAAAVVKKDLGAFKRKFDSAEYGGALLLGTKKPVIKAHGSSDAKAFYNAIRQAISCCENNIIGEMESQLAVETAEAE